MNIESLKLAFNTITQDPAYLKNIQYGKPRRGHDEGTIQAHIAELEQNLNKLLASTNTTHDSVEIYWKLRILIHVHDTFKAETTKLGLKNCPIEHPSSHASLAAAYLSRYVDDPDLIAMVQYHDLGYALYRNFKQKGKLNELRLMDGLSRIKDLNLYLLFCIIDSCTVSKGREMIHWWIQEVNLRYPELWVSEEYILPGASVTESGAW